MFLRQHIEQHGREDALRRHQRVGAEFAAFSAALDDALDIAQHAHTTSR